MGGLRRAPSAVAFAMAFGATADAQAGSVRLWASAVVVDDTVRLSDLCELRGFDEATERSLRELAVADAPSAGGSRVIHLELIRSALAAGGTNMATVSLRGATRCAVSRPARAVTQNGAEAEEPFSEHTAGREARAGGRKRIAVTRAGDPRAASRSRAPTSSQRWTLRRAVVGSFNVELERYGGTADVVFDQTSDQILDLSGPAYEFKVRRRGGSPLGVRPLEVDVVVHGRAVQTVPLVVQVAMRRGAVVARRSINQGATISAADLDIVPMSFTRLDKLGVDDAAQAIGQRAKRFVPAGTLIMPSMLESVPLVMRGQLVTLTSTVGAVRVTTTAKAAGSGLFGEVIKVRAMDNKRVEFDGVVTGPGAVRVGTVPMRRVAAVAAAGGQP